MSKPRSSAGGFTLVEVLVALLVMAVMAGMAWRGVDGIVRTRAAAQARLERTLRLNTVIGQWEQDLAAIQQTAVVRQSLTCDGKTVRMTRRTPDGLQIVAWSLRPGEGGADWVRWASPSATTSRDLQERWMQSQQLQDNAEGGLPVLGGLSSWQVYFFYPDGNLTPANCLSSGDEIREVGAGASAPRATNLPLPSAVRLVLAFAPGGGANGELTRDVLIGP
jgi:general secretion pathway protein J